MLHQDEYPCVPFSSGMPERDEWWLVRMMMAVSLSLHSGVNERQSLGTFAKSGCLSALQSSENNMQRTLLTISG